MCIQQDSDQPGHPPSLSEDSDQPGHLPSLIRVFAVRMKKDWALSYPLSTQRPLWSNWVDAQPELSSLGAYAISLVLSWGGSYVWYASVEPRMLECFSLPHTNTELRSIQWVKITVFKGFGINKGISQTKIELSVFKSNILPELQYLEQAFLKSSRQTIHPETSRLIPSKWMINFMWLISSKWNLPRSMWKFLLLRQMGSKLYYSKLALIALKLKFVCFLAIQDSKLLHTIKILNIRTPKKVAVNIIKF